MSAAELATVFSATGALIASIASAYVSFKTAGKVRGLRTDVGNLEGTASEVKKEVNGRMTQLVRAYEQALRRIVKLRERLKESEASLVQAQQVMRANVRDEKRRRLK